MLMLRQGLGEQIRKLTRAWFGGMGGGRGTFNQGKKWQLSPQSFVLGVLYT